MFEKASFRHVDLALPYNTTDDLSTDVGICLSNRGGRTYNRYDRIRWICLLDLPTANLISLNVVRIACQLPGLGTKPHKASLTTNL